MADAVRCLKLESPAGGVGTQLDTYPTELNPLNDALTALGVYLQDASASVTDKKVIVERIGLAMRFIDGTTARNLSELVTSVSGAVGSHNALLDPIHYMADGGPADAYTSGMFQQTTYLNNGPLVGSVVWYTSNTLATKIIGCVYTYTGPLLSTITRTLYGANNSVVRTFVDTMQYNGPLKTGSTRTYT